MTLREGSCAVARCRGEGEVGVILANWPAVAFVCSDHAEALGPVAGVLEPETVTAMGRTPPPYPVLVVHVELAKAAGWRLVMPPAHEDRAQLYPPGEPLPPEPKWRP